MKSAAIVGTLSAPLLAVYNGILRKKPLLQILQGVKSPYQTGAIALQETAFVGGIAAGDKVGQKLKKVAGDNPIVEGAGAFVSGAAGALAGHPANTVLTRLQDGLPTRPHQLMQGGAHRAVGTGIFATIYMLVNKIFNSK